MIQPFRPLSSYLPAIPELPIRLDQQLLSRLFKAVYPFFSQPRPLVSVLQEGFTDAHNVAIQNIFLKGLSEGGMIFCSKAYTTYLCNLYVMHESIEKAQPSFVFPELFRSEKLLNDIKMWSMFNELAPTFADLEISEEFRQKVASLAEPPAHELAAHIHALNEENPLYVIGPSFALYGTILSGGQSVKKGVKQGFMERIEDLEEEATSLLKIQIQADPTAFETQSEKSVSFFSFSEKHYLIKSQWHKILNTTSTHLTRKERCFFEAKLIAEVNYATLVLLETIASMLQTLKKEKTK